MTAPKGRWHQPPRHHRSLHNDPRPPSAIQPASLAKTTLAIAAIVALAPWPSLAMATPEDLATTSGRHQRVGYEGEAAEAFGEVTEEV